jgi:GntR family transcriptional regulator, gluconate operon transcriptional repressor
MNVPEVKANHAVDGDGSGRLTPLETPRSLAEDAADRIRETILSGGFRPGEHLVEARIAHQLNVSRGPVREAFKLLRADGLVEEEPRRGTFVVRLEVDDVREIYQLRGAIEGQAARLLAETRPPTALDDLRRRLVNIENAINAADVRAVSRSDLEFHGAVCWLSGNRRLHEVFTRYVPILGALLRLDERLYGSLQPIADQHPALLRTIEAGNGDEAATAFRKHADDAGELIAGYLSGLHER